MSFTFVQKLASAPLAGGSPLQSAAMPSNPTVGNFLFCTVSSYTSTTAAHSVTDTAGGNTWLLAGTFENSTDSSDFERASVFYCLVANTGSNFKVSVSNTGATPETLFQVSEFSINVGNTVAIDSAAGASGFQPGATTSLTITGSATASANELLFGILACEGSLTTAGISSPCNFNGSTTGVTAIAASLDDSTIEGGQHSYVIATSAATATAFNWTYTTDPATPYPQYVGLSVAFKEIGLPAVAQLDPRRNRPGRGPYSLGRYFRPIGDMTSLPPAVAAQLAATVGAIATVTAALSTSIALAATPSSQCTVTAALTTGIALAAAPQALTTVTAGLTTAIRCAAAASSVCSVTANLTTAISMAAAAQSVVTLSATMAGTSAALAANAQAQTTLTAALSTQIALSAAAQSQSTATAALTTQIALAAAPASVCTVTAALTGTAGLAATPQARCTVTADLTTAIRMAAQVVSAAQVSATLTTQIALQASAAAQCSTTAALNTQIALASVSLSNCTVTAALTTTNVTPTKPKRRRLMSTLTLYVQNPSEIISYDLDFADRLTPLGDFISDVWDAEVDDGFQLLSAELVGTSIRAFTTGGTDGQIYRVAAEVQTTGGRVLRKEINVLVRGEPITGTHIGAPVGLLFLDGFSLLLDSNYLSLGMLLVGLLGNFVFLDGFSVLLDSNFTVLA